MHLRASRIALSAATLPMPAEASEYRLTVDTGEFKRSGVAFNGASPGPILRFTEGEEVTIHVTNSLSEKTSVHWHGLILPMHQDGVPGVSFDGIASGEIFTYRFPHRAERHLLVPPPLRLPGARRGLRRHRH